LLLFCRAFSRRLGSRAASNIVLNGSATRASMPSSSTSICAMTAARATHRNSRVKGLVRDRIARVRGSTLCVVSESDPNERQRTQRFPMVRSSGGGLEMPGGLLRTNRQGSRVGASPGRAARQLVNEIGPGHS